MWSHTMRNQLRTASWKCPRKRTSPSEWRPSSRRASIGKRSQSRCLIIESATKPWKCQKEVAPHDSKSKSTSTPAWKEGTVSVTFHFTTFYDHLANDVWIQLLRHRSHGNWTWRRAPLETKQSSQWLKELVSRSDTAITVYPHIKESPYHWRWKTSVHTTQ